MADERYRTREAKDERLRRPSSPAAPEIPEPPTEPPSPSGTPPFRIGRRSLLGLAFAGALAVIAPIAFHSSAPSLPVPDGQFVGPEYLAATLAYKPAPKLPMPPDHSKWSSCVASAPASTMLNFDLVLAIDTTGSMGGVINDVKANVAQLVEKLRTGGGSVRVGIVAYRDIGDDFVTRSFPLTALDGEGVSGLNSFIAGLSAGGGGDWPEAVDQALNAATSMNWRGDVPSSIVVIGDAPAHPDREAAALAIAQAFSSKIPGGQVSLIDAGSGAQQFMRALPKAGGGQYVTYDGHILNSLFPAVTACPSQ